MCLLESVYLAKVRANSIWFGHFHDAESGTRCFSRESLLSFYNSILTHEFPVTERALFINTIRASSRTGALHPPSARFSLSLLSPLFPLPLLFRLKSVLSRKVRKTILSRGERHQIAFPDNSRAERLRPVRIRLLWNAAYLPAPAILLPPSRVLASALLSVARDNK